MPLLCAETAGVQGLWTQGRWTVCPPGKILGVKECCCCRTGAGVRKQKTSPSLTSAGSSQSRSHPSLLGS